MDAQDVKRAYHADMQQYENDVPKRRWECTYHPAEVQLPMEYGSPLEMSSSQY